MTDFDYDLFVIGAGSGGVRAARIAANHGAKVAVAEEYRVGGTCVIRGCVPKKLLVYASRFHGEFEDAKGFGWHFDVGGPGNPVFVWRDLITNKDKEIDRLENAYRANLERSKVEIIASRATIEGANAVRLAKDNRRLTARRILVATGGWPTLPVIPGIEHAITSNEAFHLPELPKRIIIVGGGYIAVEFAGIFNGLGVKTTLVYRGEKFLRGFDDDLRDDLTAAMRKRGITIITSATPTEIEVLASGLGVKKLRTQLSNGTELDSEAIMYATGRAPNTNGLGLEAAGVALGSKGEIKVDAQSRSSVPSIFAVGDVTDRVNLTPVAIREGHAFADSEFGNKPWTTDHSLIPTGVFSEPEIGTVGMTEAQARAAHGEIDLYKARFRPMKYTLSGRDERMLMKLIVAQKSQKVVGCHILGPDAAEMVQMAAIAMRMGATKADFDQTMALHPSAAEELVTMRDKWVPPKG
ncbi:MAG: glutathione-disulfide reductase [Hyphomicrobiaceae bacterium]